MGDTLQSYIRYRKLSQCSALENFLDYRNKVYQREKLAQYAPASRKAPIKETSAQPIASPITTEKKLGNINLPTPLIKTSTASTEDVCLNFVRYPSLSLSRVLPLNNETDVDRHK